MAYLTPHLQIMVDAANLAAKAQRKFFYQTHDFKVEKKGPADFVSECDKESEEIIVKELISKRPTYGLVMEEGGEVKGKDNSNRFIIDPIDGTTNFIRKIPNFCISIGLERDRKPYAGVIYNPITDQLFYAEQGFGAYLNQQRIRVSKTDKLDMSILATGLPFKGHNNSNIEHLTTIANQTAGIRRFGSAALDLAMVASGNFDGFWEYSLKSWDITAGIAILTEAGGLVDIIKNHDNPNDEKRAHLNGNILASNGHIHQELQNLLK